MEKSTSQVILSAIFYGRKIYRTERIKNRRIKKSRFQTSDLFQMKPTRCTLLLSIYISSYLQVSGNYVPIIRINSCTSMGGCLVCRPDSHPYRVKNTGVS